MFLDGRVNLFHVILTDFIFHLFPDGVTCFCIFYPLISFFLFQLSSLFQQFECFLRKFFCFCVFFPAIFIALCVMVSVIFSHNGSMSAPSTSSCIRPVL